MTTLAVAVATPVGLVPWKRLAWVTWRRYRGALVAVVGALALVAAYLIVDGEQIRSSYSDYLACTPANSPACEFAWETFRDVHGPSGLVSVILVLLPGLVGVFAGTPILARELETGTFRFTWTQGVGRTRWALALLVPGALGVAVLLSGLGAVARWHDQPLVQAGVRPRMNPTSFWTTGLAPAGWALVGFALGVLAGLLWRRVVAGLASAFAVWFGLAYVNAEFLRPHYLAPLTTTSLQLSNSDEFLGQWWTKGGVRVSDAELNSVLQGIGVQIGGGGARAQVRSGHIVDPVQYLLHHGYQQVTSYQPDSRFWTFQWIEFGWLTVLAVVLLAASVWLPRRQPA